MLLDSILTNLRTAPENVEICAALEGDKVPIFDLYDLVILTGGKYNLLAPDRSPWFETLLDRIRTLASSDSETRLMGLCWGHQTTNLALGGKLGLVPAGLQASIPFPTESKRLAIRKALTILIR